MCGIVGILNRNGQPVQTELISRMTETLAHRGPDGDGIWCDLNIGFGHRRLAVVDLSLAGHQPMTNEDGTVILTYNGEIYNHLDLRDDLVAGGHGFRSRTDSEVIIHAYEEWGDACFSRLNGHFAFGIWDSRNRRLVLARDRYGVKPLYYWFDGSTFLFASEIKALLAHRSVQRAVCPEALNEYFTFQNILSDRTFFEGIHLLPAGAMLTIDSRTGPNTPRVSTYWDYDFSQPILQIDEEEAGEELRRLFVQAVQRQLMSDVPLGSYLSGGMDSGSITAVAGQQLGRLKTFTMGFDLSSASGIEMGFDERQKSEMLSNLLKTEHYEMVLHAGDLEHIMPELMWYVEDPRVGQCYPNYYIARLASKFVSVVLSGVGGDELFAGYPWRYYRGLARRDGADFYRSYYDFWQRLVPDEEKSALFTPSVFQRTSDHPSFEVFRSVFRRSDAPETPADIVNASLYFELKTFLHGLLLVEDKVSMAHGLETRAPFLDNDLVDFALRVPTAFKLTNIERAAEMVDEDEIGRYQLKTNDGKRILRKSMTGIIPPDITGRVKQGFSAPDASWFRGESIDYVNKLLRNPSARLYEFLQPDYVGRRLAEHSSGKMNNRLLIWSFLSLEWWLRKFID